MKRKAIATDRKQQGEQNSMANRIKQEQTQEKVPSAFPAGPGKEFGHFRKWWSEYQRKMKSAFLAAPLHLQAQIEP